jgi:hypothetical protein
MPLFEEPFFLQVVVVQYPAQLTGHTPVPHDCWRVDPLILSHALPLFEADVVILKVMVLYLVLPHEAEPHGPAVSEPAQSTGAGHAATLLVVPSGSGKSLVLDATA